MHFSVAVFTDCFNINCVENILRNYDECLMNEITICESYETIIKNAKQIQKRVLEFLSTNPTEKEYNDYFSEHEEYENYLTAETDDDFWYAARDPYCDYDEEGNLIQWYNPDGRYDWYEIGGRWKDLLYQKDCEKPCDMCFVKDLNFEAMDKDFHYYIAEILDGTNGSSYWYDNNDKLDYFLKHPDYQNKVITIVDCHY